MGGIRISAAVLVAAAFALTCCSAGGSSTGSDEPDRACLEVPDTTMQAIAAGANTTPITPVAAAAVESEDFADADIVAMSFTVEGVDEEQVGVWAVGGSVDEPGSILAVDGFAHEFTDWPNELNGEELDATEDGVDEAKACLEAAG